MKEILIIYNFAQEYRTAIFKAIDKNWKCTWIFGNNETDIKGMDTSILRKVIIVQNRKIIGPWYYQTNVFKESRKAFYDCLLILGELYNVSNWLILIRNKLSRHPKKIYAWSHGWYGREGLVKKWLKRIFFGLTNKTFLYGNYAKHVAISQGFPSDKLEVIHNSLNHESQIKLRQSLKPSNIYKDHFGNSNPVLIFIGRLTTVKRLDILIHALEMLRNKDKIFNLVLVGDGEKREDLEKLVTQKKLNSQIWFYGECYDDSQNAQLIYDAELCVAPGNIGLTAMHTMVFGTPVLTHDNFIMQMPEFEAIRPNKTGNFFEYGNIQSLANMIEKWNAYSQKHRKSIQEACYKEIDLYWTPEYQIQILTNSIESEK